MIILQTQIWAKYWGVGWKRGVMASTRLPAVRTSGSCPMINEARHKATGATRRNPANVNDNKAMSSISPPFPRFWHTVDSPPSTFPPFRKPSRRKIWNANWKDLHCGLKSKPAVSSLENSSSVVTFTQEFLSAVFSSTHPDRYVSTWISHFSKSTSKISTLPQSYRLLWVSSDANTRHTMWSN